MTKNIYAVNGRIPRIHSSAFIDPMARIMGDVTLEEDTVVLYGTIVRGDDDSVVVGKRSVILENCIIEAPRGEPVTIGEEALISHGAIVHGAKVGRGSLIGIGAIVLDKAEIGEEAIVAAGALVPPGKKVEPRTLVAGVPAKPLRKLEEKDVRVVKKELELVHRKAALYKKIFAGETGI